MRRVFLLSSGPEAQPHPLIALSMNGDGNERSNGSNERGGNGKVAKETLRASRSIDADGGAGDLTIRRTT